MQSKDIIDYVDQVMDKTDVPDEYKHKMENRLIRDLISVTEDSGADVKSVLCSPEKLARELTRRFREEYPADAEDWDYEQHDGSRRHCPPPPHGRYSGDFMMEHSDVCLKLLYIPLLQISSERKECRCPLLIPGTLQSLRHPSAGRYADGREGCFKDGDRIGRPKACFFLGADAYRKCAAAKSSARRAGKRRWRKTGIAGSAERVSASAGAFDE